MSDNIVKLLKNFADVMFDSNPQSVEDAVETFLNKADLVLWDEPKQELISYIKQKL